MRVLHIRCRVAYLTVLIEVTQARIQLTHPGKRKLLNAGPKLVFDNEALARRRRANPGLVRRFREIVLISPFQHRIAI